MDETKYKESRVNLQKFLEEVIFFVGKNDEESIVYFLQGNIPADDLVARMMFGVKAEKFSILHETPLNDGEFKFFWEVDRTGKITARLGGDQAHLYPSTYLVMTMLLRKYGLLTEERFDGTWEPLSVSWLYPNLVKIEDWAWNWVFTHHELIPDTMK